MTVTREVASTSTSFPPLPHRMLFRMVTPEYAVTTMARPAKAGSQLLPATVVWITVRLETEPDALACALAVQTCSSRKPLPTPPPLE